jgi:hypothetical protein
MKRLAVTLIASMAVVIPTSCGESSSESESEGPTLTGIGATKEDFAEGKEPNTDRQEGCCFGPTQEDGSDRYYAVEYDEKDRVIAYSMSFAPTIVFAGAQNVIIGELPPDAKLVKTVDRQRCKTMQYSSAQYRQVTAGTGGPWNIDVGLYSGPGETPYSDLRIYDIIFIGAARPGEVGDC